MGTLKPQSNGQLYSNTMIDTLAVDEREREREKFINHIQSMKQCKTMTIN